MRISCAAVLTLLITSQVSFGQVPQNWDQWLADGLAAEDKADYKVAETLLSQACDVSLAQQLGSERLTTACLALSSTYSVQGKWEEAAETTRTLVEALAQVTDTSAERRAETLIRSAEADMANGEDKPATKSIQAAIDLAREMDPEPAAAAFADIAELYAAGGPKGFAANLLEAAFRTLMAQPKKDTVLYITTATKVGRGLIAIKRWEDATTLLLPIVEAARERPGAEPEHAVPWKAYRLAAGIAVTASKALADESQTLRIQALQAGWPTAAATELTLRSVQEAPPKLTHKVEPKYTPGAKSYGIQGVVLLSTTVGADGRAHDIQVLRGLPYGLSWAAVGCVRQWRFKPGARNGVPTDVNAQIEIHFRLQ